MNEDLSATEKAQLERWAYGRAVSPDEQARALLAATELQRRGEGVAAPAVEPRPHGADQGYPTVPATAASMPERIGPVIDLSDEPRRTLSRSWRIALVGGLAALVVSGATVGGVILAGDLLSPQSDATSSLDIFERASTPEESALVGQFERQGERVSVGPRVLDSAGFGVIVAHRSLVSSSGVNEPELDLVCISVVEYVRRTQATMINGTTCVARAEFEREGLEATLLGLGGDYEVAWGPVGRAQVDVTITEAQQEFMEPGFEAAFFDQPVSDLDRQLLSDDGLVDQTGLSVSDLRTLFAVERLLADDFDAEVGEPAPEDEWLAIYRGSAVDGGDEQACIAVLADGLQLESACLPVADFGPRGLRLTVERETATLIVTWSSRGDTSVMVARPDE